LCESENRGENEMKIKKVMTAYCNANVYGLIVEFQPGVEVEEDGWTAYVDFGAERPNGEITNVWFNQKEFAIESVLTHEQKNAILDADRPHYESALPYRREGQKV
jgi:hypothetical protein